MALLCSHAWPLCGNLSPVLSAAATVKQSPGRTAGMRPLPENASTWMVTLFTGMLLFLGTMACCSFSLYAAVVEPPAPMRGQ